MEFSMKLLALHAEVNFATTLPYAYQSPFGSKHFCTCSRKQDLQKPICEPSACSTARIYHHVSDTTNSMVKMLLEILACESRQLHWGFSTKNISFCVKEVQRPISRWARSCITGQLNISLWTADNCSRICKKVGPAVISSDISPTGS